MGKGKDLSDFEKGQIVMARRLGRSISKTASVVGCSRSAVVSTFQRWSKQGRLVNQRQGHGRPRLIDECGERRLARLVHSNKKATVAQIAEEVNAGSDRKVSEHTVHRSLLRLGLRSRRGGKSPKEGGGRNTLVVPDQTENFSGSDPDLHRVRTNNSDQDLDPAESNVSQEILDSEQDSTSDKPDQLF